MIEIGGDGNCQGVVHCSHYNEYRQEEKPKRHMTAKKKSVSDKKGRRMFPIGSTVRHKSFGIGKVIKVSEGRIVIEICHGMT